MKIMNLIKKRVREESGNFDESGKSGPENLRAIVKSAILAKKLHRGAPLPTTNFD